MGPVRGKDLPQEADVQNVANYRGIIQRGEFLAELTAKPEQVVFRPFEQNEVCRAELRNLTGQF